IVIGFRVRSGPSCACAQALLSYQILPCLTPRSEFDCHIGQEASPNPVTGKYAAVVSAQIHTAVVGVLRPHPYGVAVRLEICPVRLTVRRGNDRANLLPCSHVSQSLLSSLRATVTASPARSALSLYLS